MEKQKIIVLYVDNNIIQRLTAIYCRKVRSIEQEDLSQTIYLHFVENYEKINKWRNDCGIKAEDILENQEKISKDKLDIYYPKVFNELKSAAIKFINKEVKHVYKGKVIDDHFYNEEKVRAALPYIWQITPSEEYQVHPQTGQVLKHKSSNQGLALAIMADISGAYYGLKKSEQELLELHFNKGLTYKFIAEVLNTTEDAIRQRIKRTIEKMLRKLSGSTSYWDSEKIKGTKPDV